MTPDEIRETRRKLRLSARQFAALFGYADGRTARAWESGEYEFPFTKAVAKRILSEHRKRAATARKEIKERNFSARYADILKRIANGESYADIGRRHGISRERVRQIKQQLPEELRSKLTLRNRK